MPNSLVPPPKYAVPRSVFLTEEVSYQIIIHYFLHFGYLQNTCLQRHLSWSTCLAEVEENVNTDCHMFDKRNSIRF